PDMLQSIAILEDLRREFPGEPKYTYPLVRSYTLLAWAQSRGNKEVEERWLRRATDLGEQLVAAYPEDREYRARLGATLSNLSIPLGNSGRRAEKERISRRAVLVLEALPEPRSRKEKYYLVHALTHLARSLHEAGRFSEALEYYQKGIQVGL